MDEGENRQSLRSNRIVVLNHLGRNSFINVMNSTLASAIVFTFVSLIRLESKLEVDDISYPLDCINQRINDSAFRLFNEKCSASSPTKIYFYSNRDDYYYLRDGDLKREKSGNIANDPVYFARVFSI